MLPKVQNQTHPSKTTQLQFGGYDHRRAAGNGSIYDMGNLSADEMPLLSPRKPRYKVQDVQKPNGIYAADELYLVDGTQLYVDGVLQTSTLTDSPKTFAMLGDVCCIWPDKKQVRRGSGAIDVLEWELTFHCNFVDYQIYGEPAEGCGLLITDIDPETLQLKSWYGFRVGDAVKIQSDLIENNKTAIIREIPNVRQEGTALFNHPVLVFDENTFVTSDHIYTVTVTREVPNLDYVCVNENRIWGCKGDTIYASKLGDPYNWNVFDGLSTDSWAVDVGTEGDFTGCVSFMGYPIFMKENHIYKVYGDKPSNFHVMQSADLGTESGSGHSFGIANEVLFYLSRAGMVAYTGGLPQNISAVFGPERYKNAIGGSDGLKYYVSMEDAAGRRHLFVYDTRYGAWHREDDFEALGIVWYQNGLWALRKIEPEVITTVIDQEQDLPIISTETGPAGELWYLGGDAPPAGSVEEETVESWAEFGDFDEGSPQRKGSSHVEFRVELEEGASLTAKIMYDSDGEWHSIGTLAPGKKRSEYLPVIPRRCDHWRIRLEGTGMYYVYSMTRTLYVGSEFH